MAKFNVRTALPEDAEAAAGVLRAAFAGDADIFPEPAAMTAGGFEVALQTGHRLLVAEADGQVAGVIRTWDDEGIGWFDWLASSAPWAGRALLRAAEAEAQNRGIRLLRADLPTGTAVEDYFERVGYRPIGRKSIDGHALTTVERRLPLLTVREQRRSDADAIAAIAGIDPWPLAQENRPGWFVLSDGDRVVGVIWVKDAGAGRAEFSEPVLFDDYHGRRLELWMIDRATTHAETKGFHTAEIAASPLLDRLKRELEDRRWFPEGPIYRKALGDRPRTALEDWSTDD